MQNLIHPSTRALSDLNLWKRNYNKGDVQAIANGIRRFGYNRTISVWREGIVIAGNHTLKALKQLQKDYAAESKEPPKNVTLIDGDWHIMVSDASHLSYVEAEAYGISDNHIAQLATHDDVALATLLQELKDSEDTTLLQATAYTDTDLQSLLNSLAVDLSYELEDSDESNDTNPSHSDGSLLALTQVTIDDPRHIVEKGDVFYLGDNILICADVLTQWQVWQPYLQGEQTIFVPYSGVYMAISKKSDSHRLVMVQPDTYIAGHIIDRFADAKGEQHVRKA